MFIKMACRWESSKRPLFVKTVWLDGYRHTILSKEDPALKNTSPRLSANRSEKERPKSKQDEKVLTIPAVQMLLENVRRLKKENEKISEPTREKLKKSLTFDVIMRDDMKISSKGNVNSVEIDKTMYSSLEKSIFNSDRFEQSSNSLTERVLLWLDLAGRVSYEKPSEENIKPRLRQKNLKRNKTAHPDIDSPITSEPINQNCHPNGDDLVDKVQESISDFSILTSFTAFEEQSYPLTEIIQEEDEYRIANMELANLVKNEEETNGKAKISPRVAKRQVHIFIPNIAKKINENNSVVSGYGSSVLSTESQNN